MRQVKAKAMRRADPSRPNPGRLHGGVNKHEVHRTAKAKPGKWLKSMLERGGARRIGKDHR